MAAQEIGVFPRVPFLLLIIEIVVLSFDSLREKLGTYDCNTFCVKCKRNA